MQPPSSKAALMSRPASLAGSSTIGPLAPHRAPKVVDVRGIDEAPRKQFPNTGPAAIVLVSVGKEDRAGFHTLQQVLHRDRNKKSTGNRQSKLNSEHR